MTAAMPGAPPHAVTVLLVRHGETDWNRIKRLQGHLDVPLNAVGQEQAQRMGAALAGRSVDHIYSSDLVRAQDTARAVLRACQAAGAPLPLLTLDEGLRERHFGALQGQTASDVLARQDEASRIWRDRVVDGLLPGGESLAVFHARVIAAVTARLQPHLEGLRRAEARAPTLLFVAHGGVLDSLYRHARQVPLQTARTWTLPNCALHHLEVDAQGRWTVRAWADESHLQGLAPRRDEIAEAASEAGAA